MYLLHTYSMFVSVGQSYSNSLPSTTTAEAFTTKLQVTPGKLHVDVGFWGGVVPRNEVC